MSVMAHAGGVEAVLLLDVGASLPAKAGFFVDGVMLRALGVATLTGTGAARPFPFLLGVACVDAVMVTAPLFLVETLGRLRSRNCNSFLYTLGGHGGRPLGSGRSRRSESLLQAISAQACDRAISSSGFRFGAVWREWARREKARETSSGGRFDASDGKRVRSASSTGGVDIGKILRGREQW